MCPMNVSIPLNFDIFASNCMYWLVLTFGLVAPALYVWLQISFVYLVLDAKLARVSDEV